MKSKSILVAYLLLLTGGGIFGAHLFYLKKYKRAVLYLFTFGLCGIGWAYDLFTLITQVENYNNPRDYIPAPLPKEFYE